MKCALGFFCVLLLCGSVQAGELDALALLKRDLGATIELISKREIRYCPDNTCNIFRVKDSKHAVLLPGFVYLYLFHQSSYIYLNESIGGSRPFRELAKGTEALVRKQVEGFCRESKKMPLCVMDGMEKALAITVTFGRYDEGKFDES